MPGEGRGGEMGLGRGGAKSGGRTPGPGGGGEGTGGSREKGSRGGCEEEGGRGGCQTAGDKRRGVEEEDVRQAGVRGDGGDGPPISPLYYYSFFCFFPTNT